MRPSTLSRVAAGLCLAAAACVFNAKSFADSYTTYTISAGNSGNVANVGLTDSGSLTTYNAASSLYSTFTPPSTFTTSATLPGLTFDNGSTCGGAVSGLTSVITAKCNGGREVVEGYTSSSTLPSLYLLENGLPLQLIYSGAVDNILLDAMGDVAFVGTTGPNADSNYFDYDATSRAAAVTPEPSSLVLLLTGGMGTAAMWRRRLRAKA